MSKLSTLLISGLFTIGVSTNSEAKTLQQMQNEAYKNRQKVCEETLPVFKDYVKEILKQVVYDNNKYRISIYGDTVYADVFEEDFVKEKEEVIDEFCQEIIDNNLMPEMSGMPKEDLRKEVVKLVDEQDSIFIPNEKVRRLIKNFRNRLAIKIKEIADRDVEEVLNQYEYSIITKKEAPRLLVNGYEEFFEYKDAACRVFVKLKTTSPTYKLYNTLPLPKNQKQKILKWFNLEQLMYGPYDEGKPYSKNFYTNIIPENFINSLQVHFSEVYPVIREGKQSTFYKSLF